MAQHKLISFTPYDNESDVLNISNLSIENRVDRITIQGDIELTRDKVGLKLAEEMQSIINLTVETLKADANLPDAIAVDPPTLVKNPFAS